MGRTPRKQGNDELIDRLEREEAEVADPAKPLEENAPVDLDKLPDDERYQEVE